MNQTGSANYLERINPLRLYVIKEWNSKHMKVAIRTESFNLGAVIQVFEGALRAQ